MVRYKTEPGEKEQKILAEISLNTPNNLKRRKVTSAVSAVLCVIYAAFAVWMFVRGVVDNGFLLLGFAVLFLLIILFSKKFQLSIMQKVMKKKSNAVLGGTLEYVIDDDGELDALLVGKYTVEECCLSASTHTYDGSLFIWWDHHAYIV